MNRYDPIMFTGLDRCGKTTTRKLFAEYTKQKFITWDRSFVDNLVFDEVFRIKPTEKVVQDMLFKYLIINPTIIYLKLDFKEANERTFNTEGFKYKISELKKCEKVFGKYLKKAEDYGIRVELVDCNDKTPKQIVKEIYGRLRRK